ncbi:hypothetical protein BBK82_07470 [Lentzea guizhouensis]|uniref:Uncharacterized protein n=1 Tax=Lentzea guizhouensis TaxID=1586287 RepID=A0A1B2HE09_9PSEU|nr:hypothetical protein BBK82_07470 [Lentzea guizhouensis]
MRPAALLAQIAEVDSLSHTLLDGFNSDRSNVHRLRSLLVHASVLPARDEHLSRTDLWLSRTLAELPGHLQRIIRPYAQWEVLRPYRDRPPEKWLTPNTAGFVRSNISVVVQFLLWLDDHELSLGQLTQDRLDSWPIGGTTARHGLTADLHVPLMQRGDPAIWLDEDEH